METYRNAESTMQAINDLRAEAKKISRIVAFSTNVPMSQILPIVEDALAEGGQYELLNRYRTENPDADSINEGIQTVTINEEAVTGKKRIRYLRRNIGPRYVHYRVRSFAKPFPRYTRI